MPKAKISATLGPSGSKEAVLRYPYRKKTKPLLSKILITAGSTWVKIDDVRILTNIFTGKTGIYLAEKFNQLGYPVTLFLNPHCVERKITRGIKVIPFRYYDDLEGELIKELKKNDYDVIIHSAAISDYKLKEAFKGKIPSGRKELTLKLTPTAKIIKTIRKLAKETFLIQFKLQVGRKGLIEKAYQSLRENKSDLVVANIYEDLKEGYKAFIINKDKKRMLVTSKKSLFDNLHRFTLTGGTLRRIFFRSSSRSLSAGRDPTIQ
ncbi:MAG: hypothetical protein KKC11_01090 [Candidatus Omnitrophica bacterium]|nr:hypothetical protein [Candidatus Omnitrophota bacterium]